MAVDVDLDPVARQQRQFQAAQQFARQKFLEQVQILAKRADLGAEAEAEEFVAHGQKARRLQTDDRRAGLDRGLERRQHATGLVPRLADHAHRQIGAAATQRAVGFRIVRRRARDAHAIAARRQDRDGGFGDPGIEMLGEGVDEQPDVAPLARTVGRAARERPRCGRRQRPLRGQPQQLFSGPGDRRQGVADLHQPARREAPASEPHRQAGEQSRPQRDAVDVVALGEIFGLDQHHVDGAGTFLLAGLARHAQVHGGGEARVAERVVAIIAVQRRLERGDARFGGMGGIVGDAIAGTHHAAALALAFAVVHADCDRLGVIAAARRNAGIGVADAVGVVARPVADALHACPALLRASKNPAMERVRTEPEKRRAWRRGRLARAGRASSAATGCRRRCAPIPRHEIVDLRFAEAQPHASPHVSHPVSPKSRPRSARLRAAPRKPRHKVP